jgi:hypothetical protein
MELEDAKGNSVPVSLGTQKLSATLAREGKRVLETLTSPVELAAGSVRFERQLYEFWTKPGQ